MEDPGLIQEFVAQAESYRFRLGIIKAFFFGSAVFLMVTVLFILVEDFFSE